MDSDHSPSRLEPVDQHRRWLRILSILDACHWVGLTPITTNSLHVITYLSEVLAPTWKIEPLDGKVLKQSKAPYYPTLQQDVDRLIGMGLIRVDSLDIGRTDDGSSILLPRLSLESKHAEPILTTLRELPGEGDMLVFFREVVEAFSRLSDEQTLTAMSEDATYGNPAVDSGQVIDLGEWLGTEETATSHATGKIREIANGEMNPAEIIDVYVNHIACRVSHG
ncbi:hypothetical protein [Azospira restricta]|uniref:Uncharacterized protein n=1 Tax=Azospira restricta TaxID=404405 RepID=A0A974Y4E0_9RHOO|nr:hypothetical protein [Azospira restricta]QRJ64428.1 hypothetical protein IWH25_03495 [Azospira restricta]